MRVIRCDCGFEVFEDGDDALVTRARDHAQGAHGMDLPAELVLALTRPKEKKAAAVAHDASPSFETRSTLRLRLQDTEEGGG